MYAEAIALGTQMNPQASLRFFIQALNPFVVVQPFKGNAFVPPTQGDATQSSHHPRRPERRSGLRWLVYYTARYTGCVDSTTFDDDPIRVYLREVRAVPSLTTDQEFELSKHVLAKDQQAES